MRGKDDLGHDYCGITWGLAGSGFHSFNRAYKVHVLEMPSSILAGLVACNLIWAANPAVQKILLESHTPIQTGWLRYLSSFAAYLVFAAYGRFNPRTSLGVMLSPPFVLPGQVRRSDWFTLVLIGFAAFCFTPVLQITGLDSARAVDNVLVIILEPLTCIALAALFLRERINRQQWIGIALAIFGFVLFTGMSSLDPRGVGTLLMLVSVIGDALFTVLGRKLLNRIRGVALYGTTQFIGLLILTVICWISPGGLPNLSHISLRDGAAIFWIGPLGTAFTFAYWSWALEKVPVAAMALTLFVQPVCGVLLSYFWLGDRLSLMQGIGAALMLMAVAVPTFIGTEK